MSDYVLFSCVGSTDPIRNNFDGGLLHIIRHYRPRAVMIFLSEEMGLRELKDARFSRSVELLAEKIDLELEIELVFSEIKNAHDFDAYLSQFAPCLDKLNEKYPGSTILLNVSSGTPQMQATLCLEAVVSPRPLLPVQVKTPEAGANQSRVVGKEYDVAAEFYNNLDNEPSMPNRCSEPDILSFKRTLARGQILALIRSYKYEASLLVLQNYYPRDNTLLVKMLEHLVHRLNLNDSAAAKTARDLAAYYPQFDFYPVKDAECRRLICEYHNIIKTYQRTGQYTDFVLRLNPLVDNLQEIFLREVLDFDLTAIADETPYGERKINLTRFRAVDEPMFYYVNNNFYGGALHDQSTVNIRLQNAIITFLLRQTNDQDLLSLQDFFGRMQKLNQKYRNAAAHSLSGVTKENIQQYSGLAPQKIITRLEAAIKFIFKNRCKTEIFNIYDHLNRLIEIELGRQE